MDYERLCRKRDQLKEMRRQLPKEALESFDKSFEIEYAHNSTAIEGNTLSLIQTKAVLELEEQRLNEYLGIGGN